MQAFWILVDAMCRGRRLVFGKWKRTSCLHMKMFHPVIYKTVFFWFGERGKLHHCQQWCSIVTTSNQQPTTITVKSSLVLLTYVDNFKCLFWLQNLKHKARNTQEPKISIVFKANNNYYSDYNQNMWTYLSCVCVCVSVWIHIWSD